MSGSLEFRHPDHFTAGALGPPGARVFYLQAREGAHLITLRCEKEHVGALGEYLAALLARLGARADPVAEVPLEEPLRPAWTVGALRAGYDRAEDRIVVEAAELPEEDQAAERPASARFHLTRAQAAAFVERARALMAAGRPVCPVCGDPVGPEAHRCRRRNGHELHTR